MKTALISDVHGNLPALEAVLADIKEQVVDRIVFLGDAVGYGPRWLEVIQLLEERTHLGVLGNHDWAVLHQPVMFTLPAAAMVLWTQLAIAQSSSGAEALAYLESLPQKQEAAAALYVHASPKQPLTEYILPEMNPSHLMKNFNEIAHLAFVGHSHIPHFWKLEGDTPTVCKNPDTETLRPDRKYIINVGAVGQPRQIDPRATYVIREDDILEYRRIAYDTRKHIQDLRTSTINTWFRQQIEQGKLAVEDRFASNPFLAVNDLAGYLANRIENGS